jgi:hypothetical protein
MVKGLIPFSNVCELIVQDKFGWFLLTNLSGTQTYAGSHIANDDDGVLSPGEIVDQLTGKLKLIGDGAYKLQLKKLAKSPNSVIVSYSFNYGDVAVQAQQPVQMQGVPLQDVEQRIEKAVAAATFQLQQQHAHRLEMDALKREFADFKAAKKEPKGNYKELATVGKMALGMIAAKFLPDSVPMINKMLAADGDDEEEEEETPNTVNRS